MNNDLMIQACKGWMLIFWNVISSNILLSTCAKELEWVTFLSNELVYDNESAMLVWLLSFIYRPIMYERMLMCHMLSSLSCISEWYQRNTQKVMVVVTILVQPYFRWNQTGPIYVPSAWQIELAKARGLTS